MIDQTSRKIKLAHGNLRFLGYFVNVNVQFELTNWRNHGTLDLIFRLKWLFFLLFKLLFYSIFVGICHLLPLYFAYGVKNAKGKRRGPEKQPRKRGPDHGNYKHGMGGNRDKDPELYAAWIEGVLKKDKFRCFISGETNKNRLCCHHLYSWTPYVDLRYEVTNGVAICIDIHDAFHNEYGRGNNTPQQFERFLEQHYNITEYPWAQDNHEPILTTEEVRLKRASQSELNKEKFINLVAERGHQIIHLDDHYKGATSVVIYCP